MPNSLIFTGEGKNSVQKYLREKAEDIFLPSVMGAQRLSHFMTSPTTEISYLMNDWSLCYRLSEVAVKCYTVKCSFFFSCS